MSVNLYTLHTIKKINGEKVAVYVNSGNWPDDQILADSQRIVDGDISRVQLIKNHPWLYGRSYECDITSSSNRAQLIYFTRILRRGEKLANANEDVDKAIFVWEKNPKTWKDHPICLYQMKFIEAIKCDTPHFMGCTFIKPIQIK